MTKPQMLDPLTFTCEACNAAPGKPCNAPTNTGRRDVRWFHVIREDRAIEAFQDRSTENRS